MIIAKSATSVADLILFSQSFDAIPMMSDFGMIVIYFVSSLIIASCILLLGWVLLSIFCESSEEMFDVLENFVDSFFYFLEASFSTLISIFVCLSFMLYLVLRGLSNIFLVFASFINFLSKIVKDFKDLLLSLMIERFRLVLVSLFKRFGI